MTELTYINDQQIINDAAQLLIESHLRWSGSGESMPSKDRDNVWWAVANAYLEARFTVEEWNVMDESSRKIEEAAHASLFRQAAKIADQKWLEAMTLLSI